MRLIARGLATTAPHCLVTRGLFSSVQSTRLITRGLATTAPHCLVTRGLFSSINTIAGYIAFSSTGRRIGPEPTRTTGRQR